MFWSICSIVVSILWFYWLIDLHGRSRISPTPLNADFHKGKQDVENGTSKRTSLFVGIMSKPDNFLQRKSLRDTWLRKVVESNDIQYKFLIGKHLCDVHLLDRSSEHSCKEVKFSVSEDTLDNTTLYANSKHPSTVERDLEPCLGFSFVVHHPIIVHSLGVNLDVPIVANGSSHVKVVLTDLKRKIDITSVTFNIRSLSNSWDNKGYDFKRLMSPVLLPKGFEGSVKVKIIKAKITRGNCKRSSGWSHGGLIGVLRMFGLRSGGGVAAAGDSCILATFSFTINDLKALRQHIEGEDRRRELWLMESEYISEDVRNEADLYGDILFLNMIDVYRHLPLKLKLFIKWVYDNHNPTYLLKTDDDTMLDVARISAEVFGHAGTRTGWHWWSCMRLGWPVQRSGKFREDLFVRESYPMFPSGAGYVLAPEAVAWLNHRMDNLSAAYQGEDTALGIWLEAMSPRPLVEAHTECHWSCGEHHKVAGPPCNAMQLTVRRMYSLWGRYLLCGQRICDG